VALVKVMVGDKDPGVVAHVLQFLLVVAEVRLILFTLRSDAFHQQMNTDTHQYHISVKLVIP
jgi:hypothetical protein